MGLRYAIRLFSNIICLDNTEFLLFNQKPCFGSQLIGTATVLLAFIKIIYAIAHFFLQMPFFDRQFVRLSLTQGYIVLGVGNTAMWDKLINSATNNINKS